MATPSLFGLPRELRDMIIESVLLSPPILPKKVVRKSIEKAVKRRPDPENPYPIVLHLEHDDQYRPTALSLLLVCHQINAETQTAIKRTNPCPKLDLKYLDRKTVLPTWHYIPTRSSPPLKWSEITIRFGPTTEPHIHTHTNHEFDYSRGMQSTEDLCASKFLDRVVAVKEFVRSRHRKTARTDFDSYCDAVRGKACGVE